MPSVTSVSFENLEYSTTPSSTNNLFGNIGDRIKCTIVYDSDGLSGPQLDFWFGLRESDYVFYPFSGDFAINNNAFANPQTGAIQKISVDDITAIAQNINFGTDQSFNTVESFTATFGANITIEIIFTCIPYLLNDNIINPFTNPFWSTSGLSLMFLFKIELRDAQGQVTQSTDDIDLSAWFQKGNFGAWNERFAGQKPFYVLDYIDPITNFDGTTPYNVTARLKTTSSSRTFTPTSRISLTLVDVPTLAPPNLSMLQNQRYEVSTFNAGSGAGGINRLGAVTSTILSPDELEVSFTLEGGNYADTCGLWFRASSDDELKPDHNNTSPTIFEVVSDDDPQQGTLTFGEFGFLPWWQTDETKTNECFQGFKADDATIKIDCTNSNPEAIVIQSFEIGIQDTANNVEIENFLLTQFPQTVVRNRQRATGDRDNEVTVELVGNTYQFSYGFQVWDALLGSTYRFFIRANYTYNGQGFSTSSFSPDFNTADFGELKNTPPQPQLDGVEINFFELDGSNNILNGPNPEPKPLVNNLVVARWETTDPDMERDQNQLAGYLGVIPQSQKGLNDQIRYIFSAKDNESNSPWQGVNGFPPNRAKVTKLDNQNATVEAVLDWASYSNLFGTEGFCVVARLDATCDLERKEPPVSFALKMFHSRNIFESGGSEPDPEPTIVGDRNIGETEYILGLAITGIHTYGTWQVPPGGHIGVYHNTAGSGHWLFFEEITNFGDAPASGTKVSSSGRTAGGNDTVPDPAIWDNSTAPSGGGYVAGVATYPSGVPTRKIEYETATGQTATIPAGDGNQITWIINNHPTDSKIYACRVIASPAFQAQSATLLIRRIS